MSLLNPFNDEYYMRQALAEAHYAAQKDEVPVGAIIVCKDKIIARTHNLTEQLTDFTAHAEMQAYTAASDYLGNKYLNDCILYVTLEPCIMCAGASFWTRIGKVVYGAKDPRRGFSSMPKKIFHPSTQIIGGILEEECAELMKNFFIKKR